MTCHGNPIVVATFSHPPYTYDKNTIESPGLAAEIVKKAFERMKQPLSLKYFPFARSVSHLAHEEVDAVFPLRMTKHRKLLYKFSKIPSLKQDIVIFSRRTSKINFTGELSEISDVSIGIVNKNSYGEKFDNYISLKKFKKVEISNSHEENFRKLLGGRMDVLICSRNVGLEILRDLDLLLKKI